MNDLTPIRPDLAELISVGNRPALLLPEDWKLHEVGPWVVEKNDRGFTYFPYIEGDWRWADGLARSMDDDWARAVEAGRIGPDHPDNALDDEPVFEWSAICSIPTSRSRS